MKRRNISSDSSEKKAKLNNSLCSTPKRANPARFVTPFKTPLKSPLKPFQNSPPSAEPAECVANKKHDASPAGPSEIATNRKQMNPFSQSLKPTEVTEKYDSPTTTKTPKRTFHTPLRSAGSGVITISPMQAFLRDKKLQKELEEKESLLRKFRQYTRAKESGEIEKLEGLVVEWRGVCQEVLVMLLEHGKKHEPTMTLGSIMRQLRVNPALVNYDEENEDFND